MTNPIVPVLDELLPHSIAEKGFLYAFNVNTNPYSRSFRLMPIVDEDRIMFILGNTPEELHISKSGRENKRFGKLHR